MRGKLETEDVIQECFSKAWQSLGEFEYRGEETLFRWLCTIAERIVLKAAERERKRPLLTLRHEVEARRASPSRAMRREERFDRLQRALEGLGPEHRQVILQARIEGLPIKEIAARTGRSPGAVSMLLSRALQKLKEAFGDTESLSLPDQRLENQGQEQSDDGERG